MDEDNPSLMATKVNFELLCDVDLPISLSWLLPMLETIHALIKFVQKRDVFVCDYVVAIKICPGQLYSHYSNPNTKYVSNISKNSKICWITCTTQCTCNGRQIHWTSTPWVLNIYVLNPHATFSRLHV
jgi:hypothetical protein